MAIIGTVGLAGILLVPETANLDLRTSIYGDPAAVSGVTAGSRGA